MFKQRDGEPRQHEARHPAAGAAQQQQVDRHVKAADAEGEEGEVDGVGRDVVQELENGKPEKITGSKFGIPNSFSGLLVFLLRRLDVSRGCEIHQI